MLRPQYDRLKVLGRGSYGQAVLVKEHGRGELRVIKEIDLSRLPAAARDQAKNEAEVLRKLKHPNIIGYYDTYLDDQNKLCIVMEFADGGDLAALIKQRKTDNAIVPQQEAMDIFAQCCFALQMIHCQHILHRDLKSQNIFLTSTQVVKLGDFGIAKVLDHTAAQANTLIGTPVYLAPEVCDSRPYGIRADIWSLGVVLYELCALRPPFQAENLAALLMKIVKKDPDPLPAACDASVRQLVSWMLSKEPGDRPSMEDILAQVVVKEAAARLPGGGGAAQVERGRQQAACRPESAVRADSLDALVAGRRPSGDRRPAASAPRTPPVAPVDSASEFQRNREIAKQAKARAEGELFGRPPSMPSRSSSHEPSGYGDEAGRYGAAQRREAEREARRMKEQEHIQALQEAAAQAKRDRRQVQQKMQELERPSGQDVARGLEAGDAIERAVNDVQRKDSKEMEEARRLQELSEAAQQARRDRKQIQQRMQELENRERQPDGLEAPAMNDLTRPAVQHNAAMPKPLAEDAHVKALNEASAEAYRERKRLEELARAMEDEDDAGMVRAQGKPGERASRAPVAPSSWSPFADCEVKVPGNPRPTSCGRPSSVSDRLADDVYGHLQSGARSPSAERGPSRGRHDRVRGSGAGSSALRMLGDMVAGPRSATPQLATQPSHQEHMPLVAGTPDPTPRFGEEGLEECAHPLRGAMTGPAEAASPGKPPRQKDDVDLAASSPVRLSSQRRQWSPPPSRWEFRERRESTGATQPLVPSSPPRAEDALPDRTAPLPSELDIYEELCRPTSRGSSKGPGLPLPSGDPRLAVPIIGGDANTLGSLSYTASTNTISGATQPPFIPSH